MDTGVTESDTSGGSCQATDQPCTKNMQVEAYSICPRASESPNGSRAIRGRYLIVVSKAHLEKISEIGLDPWYAATYERLQHVMSREYNSRRLIGLAGRGVLSLYGTAVQPIISTFRNVLTYSRENGTRHPNLLRSVPPWDKWPCSSYRQYRVLALVLEMRYRS
jgi:hypothetical protein